MGASKPLDRFILATPPQYPRRAFCLLLARDAVLVVAFIATSLVGESVPRMFDLDSERNLPTWYASTKLFAIAALLALVALHAGGRDGRAQLVLLLPVALFVFLSIDEAASIHEMLGGSIDALLVETPQREQLYFHITGYWMFVLGPLLAAAMLVLGIAYYRLARPAVGTMRLAALGAAVFLFGATVVKIGRNFVEHPLAYLLQVTLEEGIELIGVSLILAAAIRLAAEKLRDGGPQARPGDAAPLGASEARRCRGREARVDLV